MSDKTQHARAAALEVAKELCALIKPYVAGVREVLGHRTLSQTPLLKVCGSLRRKKETVGDVEILFVSATHEVDDSEPGLFGSFHKVRREALVPALLNELSKRRVIYKRLNKDDRAAWGSENKYAVHVASGIPVDFFATTFEHWWMSVVIRTGPADLNKRLIEGARKNGLQLHACAGKENRPPFTRLCDQRPVMVASEREVFEKCGVPWLEPEERR